MPAGRASGLRACRHKSTRSNIAGIRAYANVFSCVGEEKLNRQARLILAVEAWMRAHYCDASAMRCWVSMLALLKAGGKVTKTS